MACTAIFEMFSVIMVYPLLNVILSNGANMPFEEMPYFPGLSLLRNFSPLELGVLFVIFLAISTLGRFLVLRAQGRALSSLGCELSVAAFRKCLWGSYTEHLNKGSGEVLIGTQKSNTIVAYYIQPALALAHNVMLISAIIFGILSFDMISVGIILPVFFLFYVAIAGITKKLMLRHSFIIAKEGFLSAKLVQEAMGNIRDIMINKHQSYFLENYKSSVSKLQHAYADNQVLTHGPRYFAEFFAALAIMTMAYYLHRDRGPEALAILGVLIVGMQRILPLINQCYTSIATLRGSTGNVVDALDILEKHEGRLGVAGRDMPNENDEVFESLEFEGVSFHYQDRNNLVLDGVSFKIFAGDKVGITGTTGSGKSTILDLVSGLLIPSSGCIKVNGVRLLGDGLDRWQRSISYAHQSTYLLDSTITENIAFGVKPDQVDYEKVRECAECVDLHTTIMSWPRKYETTVGVGGVRLSGGQRQRLGIARALYRKSMLLILDEATSALDIQTERLILENLQRLSQPRTLIIVSHRQSTVKFCNRIFDIGHLNQNPVYRLNGPSA